MQDHRNNPAIRALDLPRSLNALTFDVEEWFQAENLKIPRAQWSELPSRLERPINETLALLDRYDTRATFFVLGWVASRQTVLIRRIRAAGHEIASHGYAHQPINQQSRVKFRDDVYASKLVLEDLLGEPITGYRAPGYSINHDTGWALDILGELGFAYDSSIYPVRAPHGRYGLPGAPLRPYRIRNRLWEFPLPTVSILGYRLPAATGGYLRLWPYRLTERAFRQNHRRGVPVVVNVHPWELDPDQPRQSAPLWNRTLHYTRLQTTRGRLARLLQTYQFVPLGTLQRHWEVATEPGVPRSMPKAFVARARPSVEAKPKEAGADRASA